MLPDECESTPAPTDDDDATSIPPLSSAGSSAAATSSCTRASPPGPAPGGPPSRICIVIVAKNPCSPSPLARSMSSSLKLTFQTRSGLIYAKEDVQPNSPAPRAAPRRRAAKSKAARPGRGAKKSAKKVRKKRGGGLGDEVASPGRTYGRRAKGKGRAPAQRLSRSAAATRRFNAPGTSSEPALLLAAKIEHDLLYAQRMLTACKDELATTIQLTSSEADGVDVPDFEGEDVPGVSFVDITTSANECCFFDKKFPTKFVRGASRLLSELRHDDSGWIEHEDNPPVGAPYVAENRYRFYNPNFRPDLVSKIRSKRPNK